MYRGRAFNLLYYIAAYVEDTKQKIYHVCLIKSIVFFICVHAFFLISLTLKKGVADKKYFEIWPSACFKFCYEQEKMYLIEVIET